ncbi:TPA: hypothetical protein ACJT77_000687 [Citrobacter freundii]|nr:hypothetical protein [Citrobacter freundii]MDN4263905.1 hypothetical protein [Citrobacter freundii]
MKPSTTGENLTVKNTTSSNENIEKNGKQKEIPFVEEANLRDYFAAKAMAAIVRRWDGHSFGGGPDSPQYKELAEDAYFIADAMLRAREAS